MPSFAGLALLLLYLLVILWPLAGVLRLQRQPLFASAYSIAALIGVGLILILGLARLPLLPALVLLAFWEIRAVRIMVGDLPPEPSRARRRLAGMLVLPLLVVAIGIPTWLLPRVSPSTPTGPFPVGVVDLVESDPTSGSEAGQSRTLPIRVWYPGELEVNLSPAIRHRAPRELERDLAAALPGGVRPWMLRGLTRARVEAWQEPRLSTRQRRYPVVILSHGLPGTPALLVRLAAELASQGVVVVVPEHVGGSLGTVLADGQHPPPPTIGLGQGAADSALWLEGWAADGRRVLAAIRRWTAADSGGMFLGRLEVDRLGWVGQGIGGLTGEQLAGERSVSAVVMLDASPRGAGRLAGVPILAVRGDRVQGEAACEPGPLCVVVPGAGPADFTDLARWSPVLLRRGGLGGDVSAGRMAALLQEWTVGFLGHHLLGKPVDVLTGLPARFPEARVGVR